MPTGSVQMVDVGGKPHERAGARSLRAGCAMAPETAAALRALPKGDALAIAQLAGIRPRSALPTSIPLCHPLPLSSVAVEVERRRAAVEISATAETTAQTGVEMEALVAVSVAALTVYDMAKADRPGRWSIEQSPCLEKPKGPA